MTAHLPKLSVVIPVRNDREGLVQCVRAIASGSLRDVEVIIVDDASDVEILEVDFSCHDSPDLATRPRILRLPKQSGPATARNRGAEAARAETIVFVDADVIVAPTTLQQMLRRLRDDEQLHAIFGSYDDTPSAGNFVSQYRNLLHHFVHQTSAAEVSTFWAGCGAIRRDIFLRTGGFNTNYGRPSIEDIELGVRLSRLGYKIALDPTIHVNHLKRWTFWKMLKCDIFDRGIPWTRLILASGRLPNELNLKLSQRVSCALTFMLFAILLGSAWMWSGVFMIASLGMLALLAIDSWTEDKRVPDIVRGLGVTLLVVGALWTSLKIPTMFILAVSMVFTLIALNWSFYRFLARRKYPLFAVTAFPLHLFYFLYCGIALGLGILSHFRDLILRNLNWTGPILNR